MKLSKVIVVLVLVMRMTAAQAATGDSMHYLMHTDTVMLDIDDQQRKYTSHTFAPRQTVYSLGRFYAQDLDELYALNPPLAEAQPAIGQTVRVAVPNAAIVRYREGDFRQNDYAPVCYTVQAGQTAYHIAKTIFRMPVDTLLAVNGLSGPALFPGQVLQVGWMPLSGVAGTRKPVAEGPIRSVNYRNYLSYKLQQEETEPRPTRAVASWVPGTGEVSGQLFALYAAAKPGSYLKVTNLANQRFAYVKVIGTPAEGVRRQQIDITVSATAAKLLGAMQTNFYVSVE